MAKTKSAKDQMTVEEKLAALYELQQIDSRIDRIRIVRGELPLEVQDLKDELEGLNTRSEKFDQDIKELEAEISNRKHKITECNDKIKRYQENLNNVKNSREYESIEKEIEFEELEIKLAEKHINQFTKSIDGKKLLQEQTQSKIEERTSDLNIKQKELEEITAETEKEEGDLKKKSEKAKKKIDDRLITAYDRIRDNALNGLAVVAVDRDSCGGCFSKIPPQIQIEIQAHKRFISCENCGRILVDFKEEEAEA